MLETKVMHEKRRLWTNGGSEHESFSNVALSNIQEGGWKDPDIYKDNTKTIKLRVNERLLVIKPDQLVKLSLCCSSYFLQFQ